MPHYCQRPSGCPEAWLCSSTAPPTPTRKFWEKPVAEFPHAVGPVLCSLKFTPSPVVVPSSSLASERGGRAAAGVAGNPDGAKKLQGRGPLPGASHCLCSPDLWSRWLLGVRMKSTPTAPARIDKRFQSKDTHKGSFLIQLLNYLGKKKMGAVGPGRDLGAGQIARGETVGGGRSSQPRRKEKALYFLFILPGRKRKLPKPRQQYFIGQTQGTWFELTERERPSPLRHTRKSYGLLPGSSTAIHPDGLGHSPTATRRPQRAEAAPTGDATDTEGQICSSGWGRSRNGEEPETRISASTSQASG